jgi:hypothetical protein
MRTLIALMLAGSSLAAQKAPSVRLLDAADAKTKPVFGSPVAVRALRDGSLLVNDTQRRQVLKLDASLGTVTVVLDSASGATNAYGARAGGMIPYLADSTLFIDPTGLSMFVIAPDGSVAREASIPRSQDAGALAATTNGWPGLDVKGHLVYRGALTPQRSMNGGMTMGQSPDSLEIVRLHVTTRKLDTAAFIKIPKVKINVTQTDRGMSVAAELNPMQTVDDWAVLSDGSIAVIRGLDYHVDVINSDGSTSAGPKIPFEWQRMTDEDKVALIDSLKRTMATPGAPGAPSIAMMGHGGPPTAGHALSSVKLVEPSELADYRPPFSQAAARSDADGFLWVRTSARRSGAIGGPIYDVIDRRGVLVDRIQVPAGRVVVGFAKGGVVYLVARDQSGAWLERTKR